MNKKLNLRQLIKEEIKNVLKENFKSPEKLTSHAKTKFPFIELVFKESDRSYYVFTAYSSKKLNKSDIENLQAELGYAPAGYGFYKLKESRENNRFIYKWECSKSA